MRTNSNSSLSFKPTNNLKYVSPIPSSMMNKNVGNQLNNEMFKQKFSVNERIAFARSPDTKFQKSTNNLEYKPLRDTLTSLQLEDMKKLSDTPEHSNCNDNDNNAIAIEEIPCEGKKSIEPSFTSKFSNTPMHSNCNDIENVAIANKDLFFEENKSMEPITRNSILLENILKLSDTAVILNLNNTDNDAIANKKICEDKISMEPLSLTTPQLEDNKKLSDISIHLKSIDAISNLDKPCDNQKSIEPLIVKNVENIRSTNKWKTIFPIEKRDAVEVIVQFVEDVDQKILWVILKSCEENCNNLLTLINESITIESEPCLLNELKLNELVAAPYDGLYYRATIISIIRPLQKVLLRLIDYGNEIVVNFNEIKPAIQVMYEFNTFAFEVKLETSRYGTIDIGETITIKWYKLDTNGIWIVNELGNETFQQQIDDITASVSDYMDEMKQEKNDFYTIADIPTIDLPHETRLKMSVFDFSTFMDDLTITAAIQYPKLLNAFEELNLSMSDYCKNDTTSYGPNIGEICCALFEDGNWYRAECIQVLSDDMFLMKFIDYGNSDKINATNIRKMSAEYLYPTIASSCIVNTGKI